MAKKPIWMELESMSKRKRSDRVLKHTANYDDFVNASQDCIEKLGTLRKSIRASEQRIIKFLEKENQAEAVAEILRLRILRIEEMVELSALSVTRANRFYNKLVMDVSKGIDANVKYDEKSVQKMVPTELKTLVADSVEASDFYDILSKYKDNLREFVTDGGNKA